MVLPISIPSFFSSFLAISLGNLKKISISGFFRYVPFATEPTSMASPSISLILISSFAFLRSEFTVFQRNLSSSSEGFILDRT
jgi:hypothetical protein